MYEQQNKLYTCCSYFGTLHSCDKNISNTISVPSKVFEFGPILPQIWQKLEGFLRQNHKVQLKIG